MHQNNPLSHSETSRPGMTTLRVHHLTLYKYKKPVGFGQHRLLFRPRDSFDQHLLDWSLDIWPPPSDLYWVHDVFNNCVAVAEFDTESEELRFETNITLEHSIEPALHFRTDETGKDWPVTYDDEDAPDLRLYMTRQFPKDDSVERWARQFINPNGRTDTALMLETMTHAIRNDFKYAYRANPGTQTPEMTLYSLSGTCRDFALLMMEAVRALGLAARFVTGYIYVPSRDTHERQGGGSTHAWVQVFLPGAGWVEFDPTNGIIGNRDLIRVGVSRDPRQAIPLWGSHTGSRMDFLGMTVQVNVTSADDDAFPTLLQT